LRQRVTQSAHQVNAPSEWVARFARLIPARGAVLDLACGSGRHARLLAGLGFAVTAVDRDGAALASLETIAGIRTLCADLEGAAWPFSTMGFDAVVVTNYLHRPLFPGLFDALRPGGLLIYETFALGNELLGRPSNPEFLLQPGELLERVRGRLAVIAFEQGRVERPKPAVLQRICAIQGGIVDVRLDS
jgi:SAM-dependent methyltransferase